jgi:hypothetical protein
MVPFHGSAAPASAVSGECVELGDRPAQQVGRATRGVFGESVVESRVQSRAHMHAACPPTSYRLGYDSHLLLGVEDIVTPMRATKVSRSTGPPCSSPRTRVASTTTTEPAVCGARFVWSSLGTVGSHHCRNGHPWYRHLPPPTGGASGRCACNVGRHALPPAARCAPLKYPHAALGIPRILENARHSRSTPPQATAPL